MDDHVIISLYLDPSPGVVGQKIHRWCYTWLDRIPQEEVQLCRVYFIIHQEDLGTRWTRGHGWIFSTAFHLIRFWQNSLSQSRFVLRHAMQKMKAVPRPTWNMSWAVYVSLSHSNRPRVVYWKTEKVMLSVRLDTLCFRASSCSDFRTAFWKTTLNAWGDAKQKHSSVSEVNTR